jgi:hypothetical protein
VVGVDVVPVVPTPVVEVAFGLSLVAAPGVAVDAPGVAVDAPGVAVVIEPVPVVPAAPVVL